MLQNRLIASIFDIVSFLLVLICLIFHLFFSSGITISTTFLGFSSGFTIILSSDLVTVSANLFPESSPALWTTFLEPVFKESSPVSNNCFIILYFLTNDKNPYPLTYFLALGSVEYCYIAILEERVISIY